MCFSNIGMVPNSKNQRAATASRCLLLCAVVDTIQDSFFKLGMKPRIKVKSEVVIEFLFRLIQQPDIFLLEVKTITKLPRNGIAESGKS